MGFAVISVLILRMFLIDVRTRFLWSSQLFFALFFLGIPDLSTYSSHLCSWLGKSGKVGKHWKHTKTMKSTQNHERMITCATWRPFFINLRTYGSPPNLFFALISSPPHLFFWGSPIPDPWSSVSDPRSPISHFLWFCRFLNIATKMLCYIKRFACLASDFYI